MKLVQIRSFALLNLVLLLASACGGGEPTEDPANVILTQAAETVSAQLTQAAAQQPTATPEPTETPQPTATETPEATNTVAATNTRAAQVPSGSGSSCDVAGFVSDVTVSDGTEFDPDEEFTKTWRLVNNGSCTWNTNYKVVFIDGDQMDAPDSLSLNKQVAPGEQIDISVDMVAPSSSGDYQGYWNLQNDSGQLFAGNNAFYVQIEVTSDSDGPTATPDDDDDDDDDNTATITTNNKGTVYEDGDISSSAVVGDTDEDLGAQAFLSFDISTIPSDAEIISVTLNFSSFDTLSNPFSRLGCLRAYVGTYFPLESGDYENSASGGSLASWCSTGELSSEIESEAFKDAIQDILGSSNFQLHFQFDSQQSDDDGNDDQVRFSNPKLIIEYTD